MRSVLLRKKGSLSMDELGAILLIIAVIGVLIWFFADKSGQAGDQLNKFSGSQACDQSIGPLLSSVQGGSSDTLCVEKAVGCEKGTNKIAIPKGMKWQALPIGCSTGKICCIVVPETATQDTGNGVNGATTPNTCKANGYKGPIGDSSNSLNGDPGCFANCNAIPNGVEVPTSNIISNNCANGNKCCGIPGTSTTTSTTIMCDATTNTGSTIKGAVCVKATDSEIHGNAGETYVRAGQGTCPDSSYGCYAKISCGSTNGFCGKNSWKDGMTCEAYNSCKEYFGDVAPNCCSTK